jgi:hypothetical protein
MLHKKPTGWFSRVLRLLKEGFDLRIYTYQVQAIENQCRGFTISSGKNHKRKFAIIYLEECGSEIFFFYKLSFSFLGKVMTRK